MTLDGRKDNQSLKSAQPVLHSDLKVWILLHLGGVIKDAKRTYIHIYLQNSNFSQVWPLCYLAKTLQ